MTVRSLDVVTTLYDINIYIIDIIIHIYYRHVILIDAVNSKGILVRV